MTKKTKATDPVAALEGRDFTVTRTKGVAYGGGAPAEQGYLITRGAQSFSVADEAGLRKIVPTLLDLERFDAP